MPDTEKPGKIVIEGVTQEGETFRPSDWAERMSGNLGTFQGRRIQYSPFLKPAVKNGIKCVVLDRSLKDKDPEQYRQIMEFAERNKLRFCDEIPGDEEPEETGEQVAAPESS